ncbi:MAG: UDP-N-acetylmuramoyl-L-alanyl-D-glutamate--2,6-diaminopimelate ligase [Verrucomicrobia bacterium]|nr:UDP-N-acetylmuramoyl-L-alanyl-D-glutamate--2,6-diaminopimelate ligase [Verrucomicrobiota bacterium]
MQLKHLISEFGSNSVEGPLNREITGISHDSRRIGPGMLFVAVPGQNVDGHDYINDAIDRGAAAVLCQHNGFISRKVTIIRVPDVREALALVAVAFYQRPSSKLRVIGVTGTNGKTSVAFMVKHLLETAGIKTGLISTIRYEIGERVLPAQRTTPEALATQELLAQMVSANCEACVMEVSSHALDQKRVHGIEFDVAVFTNLTRDHLDYHGSMEAYFNSKKRLFEGLKRGTKRGGAVINIDDHYGRQLSSETDVEVKLTYGLNDTARLRASEIHLGKDFTEMVVHAPQFQFPARLPLIGRHNVYNALAAVGAGLALNLGSSALRHALNTVEPVPGRLENVSRGDDGFGVFVDYAHTEDALRSVLATLREITSGRVLLAFGCGGSRDSGKRFQMGCAAAELADFSIITTDNPRKELPSSIASQVEEGYRSVRQTDYLIELDRRRAIDAVVRMARAGDVVLIAGKGHETYQEFEDTVIPFDDRIYARETLDSLRSAKPNWKGDSERTRIPPRQWNHAHSNS